MSKQPLLSFITNNSTYSRREIFDLLKQRKVKVNRKVVENGTTLVHPKFDTVHVRNQFVGVQKKTYIKFYKPVGVVTSLKDSKRRKDLSSFVKKLSVPVFPVGRLDMDSEGLLLLTNDGDLANKVMHPKYTMEKKYIVELKETDDYDASVKFKSELLPRLERGIFLEDGPIAFKSAILLKKNIVEVVITEGRNRIIRRAFEHVGFEVIALKRVEISGIKLNQLYPGQMVDLSKHELSLLKKDSDQKSTKRSKSKN